MKTNILTMIEQSEVAWKTLDTLVNVITAPTKVKKEKYKDQGLIPIIDQGEKFIAGYLDDDLSAVPSGEYIIFGDHSEHIKYVDFAFIQGADGLKILKPKEDYTKYLFYAFQNFYVKEKNYKRHWSSAKETLIPIPPLELQKEIVKRLDILTELEATLEAELSLRKKQYQYYRDLHLTFDDISDKGGKTNPFFSKDVVWKSLGEVAQIVDGTHQTPKYTLSGIPFISVENIRNLKGTTKYISENDFEKYKIKPQKGDVFMTRIGDIGTCAVVENNEPLAYYVTLSLIRVDKYFLNPKYLKFFIESGLGKAELYKRTLIHAIPIKINLGDIGKIQIPIPPLETQAKIVAILDKFDRLTNSISDGLPKEIELRRKQYEYYRELLLGFSQSESE